MMRPHDETIMLRKMNAKEDVIKKGYLYTVSLNPLSYMTPPERRVGWIMGTWYQLCLDLSIGKCYLIR